jgi:hypothetical protein
MGDGTEPIPRLDAATLKRLVVQVGQCITRKDLDRLTRSWWKTYESPANGVALDQLKARIQAQRAILERNDPR